MRTETRRSQVPFLDESVVNHNGSRGINLGDILGFLRFTFALVILVTAFRVQAENCSDLSNDAKQRMQQWLDKCGSKLANNGQGKVAVTDMSLNPPKLFLLDRSNLNNCSMSTPISIGSGSGGPPPKPGNEPKSNMTPAGFHITRLHQGERYGPNNSLALDGTGTENNNSLSRGILLHAKSEGQNTIGCIGVPPEKLNDVMNALGTGSVIYNHFPQEQNGDSVQNCDGKGAGSPTNKNYHGGPGASQGGSTPGGQR